MIPTPTPYMVYLAGPYRPYHNGQRYVSVVENIEAARQASIEIVRLGETMFAFPVTPHLNTAQFEAFCPTVGNDYWLGGTMALMKRCDMVYVFSPEYGCSAGTRAEIKAAESFGMPVFYSIGELHDRLKSLRK